MKSTMPMLHSMTPGRALGVGGLVLYSLYAFASGAPATGTVALLLALFFGGTALGEPQAPRGPGLSTGVIFLVAIGSIALFGLLLQPLGVWAFLAFALPIVVAARWSYGLDSWQALALGTGFLVVLIGTLSLLLAS